MKEDKNLCISCPKLETRHKTKYNRKEVSPGQTVSVKEKVTSHVCTSLSSNTNEPGSCCFHQEGKVSHGRNLGSGKHPNYPGEKNCPRSNEFWATLFRSARSFSESNRGGIFLFNLSNGNKVAIEEKKSDKLRDMIKNFIANGKV
jgi:hypothetical protein